MTHLFQKKSLLLFILTLLLAACGPAASPAALSRDQAVNPPTPAASPTAKSSLDLQPCRLGTTPAQCGTLRVYENRSARSGRMIDLRVAVIKASGQNPAPDPIFYLAGGPGVAATEDAAKNQQFPFSLSENHDLVFVDQRGTGGSHRVLIPDDQPDYSGLTMADIEPLFAAWAAKTVREMDMDPRYYTTSVAMDDLDDVRAALGYDKINLFGHSYGATAAQYYLRQHEDHVRTVTLSGGSLLDIPLFERWAANGQRTLDLIFDRCQADLACQGAFPNLRAEFSDLNARLAEQPVTHDFTNPNDGKPGQLIYTADFLAEIIRVMTLDARNAAQVPLLIHQAAQENDWTGITQAVIKYGAGDWTQQMMEHVIRCGEKWAAFDANEVARLSEGSFLKGWYVSLAQNHALACKYTPRGEMPEGQAPQPASQVPVLIINGEADPQNPPANMAGANGLWPNSFAVVEPYQGHWLSDGQEIFCRWKIMDQFIQSGTAAGLDTGCMKSVQPPAFVLPEIKSQPTPEATAPTQPVIKTGAGDLAIASARYVTEVNGVSAGPGERILLIFLSKPGQPKLDPSNFSLQTFDNALRDRSKGEVHIAGSDGSYAICSMAGWVGTSDKTFAMGFRIPKTAKTVQLFWPGNEPIDLQPIE